MHLRAVAVIGVLGLAACRTSAPEPPPEEVRAIHGTLEALYTSFCFDAGGEADWDGMQALFLEGAAFVAPLGGQETPRAVGADEFVRDFKTWIESSDEGRTGFHERIVHTRVDVFGRVAHALVTFEGFVPPDGVTATQGVDSIQLIEDGGRWRVASFTTHYFVR
jgi:hypothetical protein